jgi:hemolysin III
MIALYFTSSSYHLYAHSARARQVMQRLDHSMIYVLIAGTYTPVCLLALEGSMRWVLLAIVWTGAIVGMAITLCALDRFPKLSFALYLVLGWAALLAIPQLLDRPELLGLTFALHRPGPNARWFGYHEYWHAFGIAAGVMFFAMNLGLIASG